MQILTIIRQLLRLGLGLLILATGVGKWLDIAGFVGVLQTYRLGLGSAALWVLAPAVAALECALGLWIVSGWRLARAATCAMLLNAGYFVLLSSALWRGLQLANCGCFGVFLARPLRWYSPLEDLALIALAWLLQNLATDRLRAAASTTIRARPDAVARLYRDFDQWAKLFPSIRAARLLREDGHRQVIEVDHRREGRVVNVLAEGPARGVELEEYKRRYHGRFVNRFEPVGGGTRYTVVADIRPKGWWQVLAGPWLGAWIRHRIRRDVLDPVKRSAEATFA